MIRYHNSLFNIIQIFCNEIVHRDEKKITSSGIYPIWTSLVRMTSVDLQLRKDNYTRFQVQPAFDFGCGGQGFTLFHILIMKRKKLLFTHQCMKATFYPLQSTYAFYLRELMISTIYRQAYLSLLFIFACCKKQCVRLVCILCSFSFVTVYNLQFYRREVHHHFSSKKSVIHKMFTVESTLTQYCRHFVVNGIF